MRDSYRDYYNGYDDESRRHFATLIDSVRSNEINPADFCQCYRTRLSYSEPFDEYLCTTCGYIKPKPEELSAPSDLTTTDLKSLSAGEDSLEKAHIQNPSAVPMGQRGYDVVYCIPLGESRSARNRKVSWEHDDEMKRLVVSGAKVIDYREYLPSNTSGRNSLFNPGPEKKDHWSSEEGQ